MIPPVATPMDVGWFVLRSGAGSAIQNMAVDEALMATALEAGRPILRFYGWNEPAASFGYFQKYAEIEATTLLRPLVRRPTGGGLVPHDADWTYSAIFPPSTAWYKLSATESYQRIHDWIRLAMARLGVVTELADCCKKTAPGQCFIGHEKFDLLWHGKKIAGAAQRRTRYGLLIQGSVQPPPIGLVRTDWERAMCEVAQTNLQVHWHDFPLTADFQQLTANLIAKTYSQDEYNRRR